MKLPTLSPRKFVITIGEDGVIFAFLEKDQLLEKLFVPSSSFSDADEIGAIISQNPEAPIYVLLDSIEQTYTKQSLPGVGPLSIGTLVKRRIEHDFAKTDITGAIPLGRDTLGNKDWVYMFVSTPATSVISAWLEYLSSFTNYFAGIYFLPLEMESVVNDINKRPLQEKAAKSCWQLIITQNRTGGFRQTVLHNSKVIFTRLIKENKEEVTDLIAGNIEQELINTVDYLHRLGLADGEYLNIFVIVSKELKASMGTTKIRGSKLILYTPFELAQLLGYEHITEENDKYIDLLIATIFANSKHVIRLNNPKEKYKYKRATLTICALLALVITVYLVL